MEIQKIEPLLPSELASRGDYRKYTKNGRQVYIIDFNAIKIRPGYNCRTLLGDLDLLADQIIAADGLEIPITVDALADGTFYLDDGERRWRAYDKIINDRKLKGFDSIEAFINVKSKTDLERYLSMVRKNNGNKPLEHIEEGAAYQKMLLEPNPETGKPMTQADIARYTGYSRMHISNMLRAAGMSDEVKNEILAGNVSHTAAVEMDKKGMSDQEKLDAIHEANDKGEKPKVEDIRKKAVDPMDGWEKVKGEEIIVSQKELMKHIGRIFAMPVLKTWAEDFIDEDTGDIVSIDRKEVVFPDGVIMEEEDIEVILETGVKIVRFERQEIHGDSKTLDGDKIFDEEGNKEADHQEKQENGLFGGLDRPKAKTLTDLLIETSVGFKSLTKMVLDNYGVFDDAQLKKFKEVSVTVAENISKAKAMSVHFE